MGLWKFGKYISESNINENWYEKVLHYFEFAGGKSLSIKNIAGLNYWWLKHSNKRALKT